MVTTPEAKVAPLSDEELAQIRQGYYCYNPVGFPQAPWQQAVTRLLATIDSLRPSPDAPESKAATLNPTAEVDEVMLAVIIRDWWYDKSIGPDVECYALAKSILAAGYRLPTPEATKWEPISTVPDCDDLLWFARGDTVDGPRHRHFDDADKWEMWAYVRSPPMTTCYAPTSPEPKPPHAQVRDKTEEWDSRPRPEAKPSVSATEAAQGFFKSMWGMDGDYPTEISALATLLTKRDEQVREWAANIVRDGLVTWMPGERWSDAVKETRCCLERRALTAVNGGGRTLPRAILTANTLSRFTERCGCPYQPLPSTRALHE